MKSAWPVSGDDGSPAAVLSPTVLTLFGETTGAPAWHGAGLGVVVALTTLGGDVGAGTVLGGLFVGESVCLSPTSGRLGAM